MNEQYDYEATLRLLTQAEVPDGMAERVKARLKTAEASKVIAWPANSGGAATWIRRAAAAAIVTVVSGGSWAVYSGVNLSAAKNGAGQKPVVMPSQMQGEFGNAGAMRKVDPLTAPVAQEAKGKGQEKHAPKPAAPIQ